MILPSLLRALYLGPSNLMGQDPYEVIAELHAALQVPPPFRATTKCPVVCIVDVTCHSQLRYVEWYR